MQELQSMGQQATGAADSQGLRAGVRDETATGSALAASSFIKRSKRTMFNIEQYMDRLVRRVSEVGRSACSGIARTQLNVRGMVSFHSRCRSRSSSLNRWRMILT